MSVVKKKIIEVLSGVLDIPISDIPSDAAPGVMDKWDSLKHITFILALEEEFDISFTDNDLTELLSLELIVKIIIEKVRVNK